MTTGPIFGGTDDLTLMRNEYGDVDIMGAFLLFEIVRPGVDVQMMA